MRTGTVGVMTNEMLKSRVTKKGPSQWVLDGVRAYKTLATAAYALGTEDSYPAQVWEIIMALDEVGVDQDSCSRPSTATSRPRPGSHSGQAILTASTNRRTSRPIWL